MMKVAYLWATSPRITLSHVARTLCDIKKKSTVKNVILFVVMYAPEAKHELIAAFNE